MTDDNIAALIAEAREYADTIDVYQYEGRSGSVAVLVEMLAQVAKAAETLEALTANTEDEREALATELVRHNGRAGIECSCGYQLTLQGSPVPRGVTVVDFRHAEHVAQIAAGFRLQGDGEATVEWGMRHLFGWVQRCGQDESFARRSADIDNLPLVSRTVTPWREESA